MWPVIDQHGNRPKLSLETDCMIAARQPRRPRYLLPSVERLLQSVEKGETGFSRSAESCRWQKRGHLLFGTDMMAQFFVVEPWS
jgi:hypothetical protein